MSTKGWGARVWVTLIAAVLLSSSLGFGGGFKYAEATLPTANGVWSGDWFREAYGWFASALHLDYSTAGKLLYANSGKNVTSSGIDIGTGDDLNGVDDLGAQNVTTVNLYANTALIDGYYPSNPNTYTFGKNGTTYWVRSEGNGDITTGADFATLFNAVNGHKHLKAGTYNVSASLIIVTGEVIVGEGPQRTILYLNNGVDDNVIESTSKNSLTIQDLSIEGNKNNNAAGSGISFLTMDTAEVNNLNINSCNDYGVKIDSSNAMRINNCYITKNGLGGIYDYKSDNTVIFETITQYNGFGVYITNGGVVGASTGAMLLGGWFESDAVQGTQTNHIKIDAASVLVKGNRINAATIGANLIIVEDGAAFCKFEDNYLTGAAGGTTGLEIQAGATATYVENNQLSGTTELSDAGTRSIIFNSYTNSINSFSYKGKLINVPETLQALTAAGDVINHNGRYVMVNASSALTMTSTPTIAPGSLGETITILNNGPNAITLQNGFSFGLYISEPTVRVGAYGGTITLVYANLGGSNYWVEVAHANGYATQNEGAATVYNTNTTVTIPHGMYLAPTVVTVSTDWAGAAYVSTIDGTNIVVTFTNPGATKHVYWRASVGP